MHKRSSRLLFLLFILMHHAASATTKRALIIAIGNYPKENGWPQLSSLRDAEYIKNTLLKDSFDNKNIRTLADGDASVKGISTAFEQLIHDVNKGDVVVIHFSCHGEQVEAADPKKPGGLDQCVVTYDALLPALSKDYDKDQAAYYRGQTIGTYLLALRSALGRAGDVVVFMDYCHSGTGTRGAGKRRGGSGPFLSHGTSTHKIERQTSSDFYENAANTKNSDNDLATFVAISATRPEEFDLETQDDNGVGIGSLTYAISKSFEHLDPQTTYRSLFAKIQSVMNDKVPEQHPLIEGTGLDRSLFGGNFVPQKPFVEISGFGDGNNQLILKAGLLAGLDTGAKVMLYRAGTNDPAKATPIASGTVTATGSFSSTVQLDKERSIGQPADGWVFVTEPAYHIKPIKVSIVSRKQGVSRGAATNFSEDDVATIKNGLKDLPLVSFDGVPELLIVRGMNQDSILTAIDGSLVDTIRGISTNVKRLNEKIQNYARCKFLKEIDLKDEDVNVSVKLVPVINGIMDTGNIKAKLVGGVYVFHNLDTVKLLVKNNGNDDVYINILDLQPDGRVNAILPNTRIRNPIHPINLKIKAGEERPFDTYRIVIRPPYGTEVFKVFVSKEEIDMEGLATQAGPRERGGGQNIRGNLSVMEKLVRKSDGIATRGADGFNSESADGTTYNIVFRIVP